MAKRLKPAAVALPGRLLTVEEFVDQLGMSVPWARKEMIRRRLAFVRVGKRAIRIPESELRRILSERLVPARNQ